METFVAATISLTISTALIIKGKKNPLYLSFAVLCFALFSQKIGIFLYGILHTDYWKAVYYLGILSIPPLAITFSRYLLHHHTFLSRRDTILTGFVSLLIVAALFTPLFRWHYLNILLYIYCGLVLIYCFTALIRQIMEEPPGAEKKGWSMWQVPVSWPLSSAFPMY